MVDDYSYRQTIDKRIRWYREHGYYNYLIQTWGGGDRNLRGQVLAELYKLRKPKRREREYKPVSDSHVDWKTGHERLTEKLEQTVRHKMLQPKAAKKPRDRGIPEFPRDQQPETAYRPEEEDSVGFISQDSGQNIRVGAFFSSLQVPAPVTKSKVPEAVSQKREPEKEVRAEEPVTEKKEKKEMLYMGIKISQ